MGAVYRWHTRLELDDQHRDYRTARMMLATLECKPLALPVYRAGTNYITRRQQITEQHTATHANRNSKTVLAERRCTIMEQGYRADYTTQTCAEQ